MYINAQLIYSCLKNDKSNITKFVRDSLLRTWSWDILKFGCEQDMIDSAYPMAFRVERSTFLVLMSWSFFYQYIVFIKPWEGEEEVGRYETDLHETNFSNPTSGHQTSEVIDWKKIKSKSIPSVSKFNRKKKGLMTWSLIYLLATCLYFFHRSLLNWSVAPCPK